MTSSLKLFLILYYIKQIDSKLPCVCTTFLFLPHFDVICDLLLNRRTATWNLFVNYIISSVMHTFWLVLTYDLLEDRCIDDIIINTFLILYYIKQIDSKLLCVCSVIDHRWCQNVVRTSVTHSAAPRVPLFCSYHILTSSVIYYWTDTRQLGIYLLII